MEIEEILDEILREMFLGMIRSDQGFNVRYEALRLRVGLRQDDFMDALEILLEDKYVVIWYDLPDHPTMVHAAFITLRGQHFIRQGGYVGKLIDKNRAALMAEGNRKQLFALTVVASVGTGGFLVWDISKFCIEKKYLSMSGSDVCFYFFGVPAFFLLMYYLIRRLDK